MPLTLGVLIIGSLYWRNDGRERWRKWRLTKRECSVRVPIQYCRLSANKTYTMVFSDLPEDRFGKAKVVQCKRRVRSVRDLITGAEWLWSAEESGEQEDRVPRFRVCSPEHRISPRKKCWGCVALLKNPGKEVPQQLLDDWARRVAAEAHYKADPLRLVDNGGMLQIPWPKLLDGNDVPIDLLLATSNDRKPECPTVREIADAWNQHPVVDYFRKNREKGIETFQDAEVENLLVRH